MMRQLAPAGMGDVLDMTRDPGTNCGLLHFGIFRPECWAQMYEEAQYGRITRPGDVAPPTPAAPQTREENTIPGAWTPEQATRAGYADYVARLRARIAADEAEGTYNPAGNFPQVDQWKKYAVAVVVVLALIFALQLVKG